MSKTHHLLISVLIVMFFCSSSSVVFADGGSIDKDDLELLTTTTSALTLAIIEPIGFGLTYASFAFSWTTSPGPPATNDLHAIQRAHYIHRNQRTLIENLAIGGGKVLNEVVSFYFKDTTSRRLMAYHFRKYRKIHLKQLRQGKYQDAVNFERVCQRIAYQIHARR